jgi:hypothetical protein
MQIRWFVNGLIFVHLFSNPNLSMVVTWMGFGIAMAAAGSAAVASRSDGSDDPRPVIAAAPRWAGA